MLRVFAVLLALWLPAAVAQTRHEHHQHSTPTAKAPEKPASATPAASAPPARGSAAYSFAGYRRFTFDEPLKDWRAVNDSVASIGGWRAYAQEAARSIEAEKKSGGGKP